MAKNNSNLWVTEETTERFVLKAVKVLETLQAIEVEIRVERAQSALAGRNIGYLSISGKPLSEIESVSCHSI